MVRDKQQEASAQGEASTEPSRAESRASGSLAQFILQAFEVVGPRKSLSLAALKKVVAEAGFDLGKNKGRLKRELNRLVNNGLLTRLTGRGASGSFKRAPKRAGKSAAGASKKKATTKKKAAAKKPKRPQSRNTRSSSAASGSKGQQQKRPTTKRRA
ncbi:histone H1t-like [Sceloporus undulatus]|uniref:histone H1t-like n=1 Tax=Sceloporus undulatus TaxID=8520 RepID=UPI001C4C4682|nr:histone H1t-like [Sceloporus undulatus]